MSKLKRTKARIFVVKRIGLVLFFLLFWSSVSFAGQNPKSPARNSRPSADSVYITKPPGNLEVGIPFYAETRFSDPDGPRDITYVDFLVNTTDTDIDGFLARYDLTTNKLYLRQDKKWRGGITPGTKQVINTSRGMLDCQETTVKIGTSSVIVTFKLVFSPEFFGYKNIYLFARDKTNNGTGWQKRGQLDIYPPQSTFYTARSSDGILSLEIHPKALKNLNDVENRVIWLRRLDTAAFANKIGSEHSMVMVIECKPDGYSFNQGKTIPIPQLSIKLPQAEIPGTLFKLSVFNEKTKKFTLTGDTYTLGTDGYKLVFPITHFSNYAIIKPTITTPIGVGVKIPLPDLLTGSFSYSVPITVPPGRKGMQPSLALSYRSSNSNSWTGVGWSLSSGYITRSTRLGPPSYNDTQDTFYFVTDSGTTELVWLVDNLYMAKVESSFTRFYKEKDDSWRILAKDGSLLYFGQYQEAKEHGSQGTFSWYLTKAQDTNGNYIMYEYYTKDQSGKTYLKKINYTGHTSGVRPTNTIEFFLEDRTDIPSSYISGAKIATAKRLKGIEVNVDGELVWKYKLDYGDYSPDTNRSLLRSVTQFTRDGKEFPKQGFEYQGAK